MQSDSSFKHPEKWKDSVFEYGRNNVNNIWLPLSQKYMEFQLIACFRPLRHTNICPPDMRNNNPIPKSHSYCDSDRNEFARCFARACVCVRALRDTESNQIKLTFVYTHCDVNMIFLYTHYLNYLYIS